MELRTIYARKGMCGSALVVPLATLGFTFAAELSFAGYLLCMAIAGLLPANLMTQALSAAAPPRAVHEHG